MTSLPTGLRLLVETGRKALAGGVIDLGASMAVVMAFGFLQNLILARLLGAEGLGHFAIVNSSMSVATLLASAGLTTSILRYGAAERDEAAAWGVFRSGTVIAAVVSGAVLLATAAFARSPGWVFDAVAGRWLPLVALSIPALVVASCVSVWLQARGRMRGKATLDVVAKALQVALVLSGAAVDGFRGCVVGMVVGSTLGGALSLAWARISRVGAGGRSRVPSRELLRFGSWGLLTNALGLVLSTADVFAVSAIVKDASSVGVYSLAVLLQQAVTIPMRAYLDARFPAMTRVAAEPAALAAMGRTMRGHLAGIAALCALGLAGLAPLLLAPVFGAEFAASAVPLWILLAGQVAWALGAVQGRALLAAGWVEGNFWAGAGAAAANVAAQLLLIPRFGIAGAATATALTNGVLFAVFTAALYRFWESRRGAGGAPALPPLP